MNKSLKIYYLFGKSPLPENIDQEISKEIDKLAYISDKREYLKAAYEFITSRYRGGRIETYSKLYSLLSSGATDLWNRSGFMHCTNQNYLLRLILEKGAHFKEDEIMSKWTSIWYCSPHQYLKIKIDQDEWIDVDCWAKHYGVPFGKYAHGFNTTAFRSVTK